MDDCPFCGKEFDGAMFDGCVGECPNCHEKYHTDSTGREWFDSVFLVWENEPPELSANEAD
jgi:hypothetical protein